MHTDNKFDNYTVNPYIFSDTDMTPKTKPFLLLFITYYAIFQGLSCSKKTSKTLHSDTGETAIKIENKKYEPKDTLTLPTTFVMKEQDFAFQFNKSATLSEVLDIAASQHKMVYMDINAKWCTPCKLMQRDVYTHAETADYFNGTFINYMVDIDTLEGPDIKLIYDIHTIPTLLWLDAKGRVIHKKEGAAYHRELLTNAQTALHLKGN